MRTKRRRQLKHFPDELIRVADRFGVLDAPSIQRLVATASIVDDPTLTRVLGQVLTITGLQHYQQPFDPSTPSPPVPRAITFGTTITGSRYTIHPDDLTQHLLVIGQSGAGKTTLFYNLLQQLPVPFWSFDLKQDYRHLLAADLDLVVLPWTEFKLNPLQPPPGVSPRRWAQVFSEVFGHATALLSGSKNYLMQQVINLYRLYGLFDEVAPPYPSLFELQQLMERDKINYVRKTANYRDTVVNRLAAMTLTAGTIFDCSEGYPLPDLLEQNVVFEFDGLGTDVQNFLMELLLTAVYEYRLAHDQRDSGLRHVCFFDEGKRVFSAYKERQDAAGLPTIDEVTAKLREFGEGLVVADQEATKLTESIMANTATKILLPTSDATQFQAVATTMRLTQRQRDLAYRLGIGDAIIQAGNREPCPVQLDNVDVAKNISDAELRTRQLDTWNELSATPRERPAAFLEQVGEQSESPVEPTSPTDSSSAKPQLSGPAKRLLEDVVEHPFTPLTERYDRFNSAYQGNKAKNELVEQGLVIERKVHAGPEKRKLLELTAGGRDYVETSLALDTKRWGRGSIVHRFWQQRLLDVFTEAGWPAKPELFDADVYVNLGETELVVEVAMESTEREADHVKRHLETGFDAVWVVCRTESIREGIRKRLMENGLLTERVTLRLVRDIPTMERAPLAEFG